jgi:hypothetical protein
MATKFRSEAEQIYAAQQAAREQAEKIGIPTTSLMRASVDEIEAHLALVDRISNQYRVSVAPGAVWGKTEAEIIAVAEAKAKARRKGAGARALVNKYGKTSAERIIARETGRAVHLKG